ncbi:T9SS type A sorting domain-containing protein, partial [Bacteroidota bacterium]
TIGMEEVSGFGFRVSCYPNPAREVVYVGLVSNVEWRVANIEIADMFGKVMLKEEPEAEKNIYSINVRDLPEGVYILRITIEEKVVLQKVVVMR